MTLTSEVHQARRQLAEMARDWRGEVPIKLHEQPHGSHYGLGSSPPFTQAFSSFIGDLECKLPYCRVCSDRNRKIPTEGDGYRDPNQDHRTRTSRAFRKVRRHAPLEFDVLYLAVMHGLNLEQITERLNNRAAQRGLTDVYTLADTAILALCGIQKAQAWY